MNRNLQEQISQESGIDVLAVKPWAPRSAISPRMSGTASTSLLLESNGSEGCYGGWTLEYPAGKLGDHFIFSVKVKWDALAYGFESLGLEARWENESGERMDWAPLRDWEKLDGWIAMSGRVSNIVGAERLVIMLLMLWTPEGRIEWKDAKLVPAVAAPPRRIRLGAASELMGAGTHSLDTNRDKFVQLCHRAGGEGIQLLCLPEVILSNRVPGNLTERAVDVPGPYIDPFCEVAVKYGMAISFSVLERANELVHNTAILIDEQGRVVAKYRKVHLATPSERWSGITPGHEFTVASIATAQAKIGLNICMDSSAMESSRIAARLGAEILLLPIMGDHRANRWSYGRPSFDMQRWVMIQQMRAMDSHMYLVAARNAVVGTGIFAPDGTTLALDAGDQIVISADVDLSQLAYTKNHGTFKDVCWYERREAAYGALSGDLLPKLP